MLEDKDESWSETTKEEKTTIQVIANGPFVVKGSIKIIDTDGTEIEKSPKCSLCRCGASNNHPFCDGSHKNIVS